MATLGLVLYAGLAMSLGMLYLPLGQALAWLSWPFAAYSIRLAELFAGFPGSTIGLGQVSLGWVAGFYLVLLGLTFYSGRLRAWIAARTGGHPLSRTALLGAGLLGLGLVAVLVWRAALLAPDGRLHLTVLDVGSGDALLVQSPTGRYLLVDGGPSPSQLSDALGRRLPYRERLDWLLVAGGSDEQLAALSALIKRARLSRCCGRAQPRAARLPTACRSCSVRVKSSGSLRKPGISWIWEAALGWRCWRWGRPGATLLLEWGDFRA